MLEAVALEIVGEGVGVIEGVGVGVMLGVGVGVIEGVGVMLGVGVNVMLGVGVGVGLISLVKQALATFGAGSPKTELLQATPPVRTRYVKLGLAP